MTSNVINLHPRQLKHLVYKIPSKPRAKDLRKSMHNLLNKFKEIILQ